MSDIIGALLHCDDCFHAITDHDGSGCSQSSCICPKSKEHVMGRHIEIAIAEHQATFSQQRQEAL